MQFQIPAEVKLKECKQKILHPLEAAQCIGKLCPKTCADPANLFSSNDQVGKFKEFPAFSLKSFQDFSVCCNIFMDIQFMFSL